jgi:hypothetical protein
MGTYAGRGFLTVGLIGGFLAFVLLEELKRRSGHDSPLNGRYQEAPYWTMGLMMMAGPILGCLYYIVVYKLVR